MKLKYVIEDVLSVKYAIASVLAGLIPVKSVRKPLQQYITRRKGKNRIERASRRISCVMGKYSYCDKSCYVGNPQTTIGKYCSIGRDVSIAPGNHPLNFLSTSSYFYCGFLDWNNSKKDEYDNTSIPCKIGNDVWIGHGVFIRDGITVGDGAAIAAGAVVVKDVPPYAVVGGVPAKVIKYRFDEETIKRLLELKWWDMDEKILKECPYQDVNKAIEFLEKYKNEKQ